MTTMEVCAINLFIRLIEWWTHFDRHFVYFYTIYNIGGYIGKELNFVTYEQGLKPQYRLTLAVSMLQCEYLKSNGG